MLALPWLAGVLTAGFRWVDLPLLLAWLAGYLFSYYALQSIKTGRLDRFRTQLLVYGIPTVLFGGLVLALRPTLLWFAPAYAVLLAVNVYYAHRRADRSLLNDFASVLMSCLMVFVAAAVAGAAPMAVLPQFLALAAYFAGTVLFVKTMIRERGNRAYYWASVGFHIAALALAAWIGWPALAVFVLLLARATIMPRYPIGPKQVGRTEIVLSLLVLVAVLV